MMRNVPAAFPGMPGETAARAGALLAQGKSLAESRALESNADCGKTRGT